MHKIRIGTGGISHETNTFSSVVTKEEAFRSRSWLFGQDLLLKEKGVRSYIGGLVDTAAETGVELAASLNTSATPSGIIDRKSFEFMRDFLVLSLKRADSAKRLDAIALILHGAGVADGYQDIEGEILRTVRDAFGKEIPIGAVLDLHGNVTEDMLKYSDILVGVKGYPHDDMYERAGVLLRLLHNMAVSGTRPAKRLLKLPWLIVPQRAQTLTGPAHDIRDKCEKCEAGYPDLLHSTFFHGFPYSDIPQAGASVVTIAGTQATADKAAGEIAAYAWSRRADMLADGIMPSEALEKALIFKGGRPVVINESSDNPGGGAPGDGTHLLCEMLYRNIPDSAIGTIADPEVVKLAYKAGVGARISCLLGGKTDDRHGRPVELKEAYISHLTDGRFTTVSPMGFGSHVDIGPCARLVSGNVSIIVSSRQSQILDNRVFEIHGIDITKMHIIGLKSTHHFRAWWGKAAALIITTDPPGIHSGNLDAFEFKNINKAYYPFNKSAEFQIGS